jgi:hypothetical protein
MHAVFLSGVYTWTLEKPQKLCGDVDLKENFFLKAQLKGLEGNKPLGKLGHYSQLVSPKKVSGDGSRNFADTSRTISPITSRNYAEIIRNVSIT